MLLKRFGQEKSKLISTPMRMLYYLDKEGRGKSVEENKYRDIIDSLVYLTTSHPDIMFLSVCMHIFKQTQKNHTSLQSNAL